VPTWKIEQWAVRDQPDELIAELYQARAVLHHESTPDDPRKQLADEIAAVRHLPGPEDGAVLVARDSVGAVAGIAACGWEQMPGRDHVLMASIEVLPHRRRQGLGRMLLDRSAELAEHRGLRLVMGRTRDNVPSGAEFSRQLGAEPAMIGEENRLDLRGVDRDLVDRWIAEGPVRAPGCRLLFVAGRTPPDLGDRAAEVLNVRNTAPREDLDVGDTQITVDWMRQYEDAGDAAGQSRWAYIGDTAVDPAHRGQGLGKWLKAAITRRILDELPEVRWVITWNARSNDAMLAINRQLGFRPAVIATTWQVTTSALRPRLAGRADAAH
jgi:mycothiol synthase